MDELGLPVAFGSKSKHNLPPKPAAEAQRGESGPARGPRGAVGSSKHRGKRARPSRGTGSNALAVPQRSAPSDTAADTAGDATDAARVGAQVAGPSPGDKRPYTSSDSAIGSTTSADQSARGGHGGRGRRGRGGHGHGGGRGEGGSEARGFFQESFCEDPWKELLARRSKA